MSEMNALDFATILEQSRESFNSKIYRCYENVDIYKNPETDPVTRKEVGEKLLADTKDIVSFSLSNMLKIDNSNRFLAPIVGGNQENEVLFAHMLLLMNRKISLTNIVGAMAITSFDGLELTLEINPLFLFGGIMDRLEDNGFSEEDILSSLEINTIEASVFYLAQIMSILCHEAFHVLYEHISRYLDEYNKGEHHATMLNYATDTIINEQLINIPSKTYNHKKMKELLEDDTLEISTSSSYYYKKLIEKYPKPEDMPNDGGQSMEEMIDNLNNQVENMSPEQLQQFQDMIQSQLDYHGGWNGAQDNNEIPTELLSDLIKRTISQAHDNYEQEKLFDSKSRGNLSGNIQEMVRLIKQKTTMNWRQKLTKKIGVLPVPFRLTKNRVNRRQPFRPELRGKVYDRIIKVIFAYDTSASMSKGELEYCLQELFSILSVYKFEVTVIEFDSSINKVYKAKKPSDIQLNVTGRMGTSFQPLFNWFRENRTKNNETITIIATDGGGESVIETGFYTNVMWLIINKDCNLSVNNPVGEVFKLNDDRKYLNTITGREA